MTGTIEYANLHGNHGWRYAYGWVEKRMGYFLYIESLRGWPVGISGREK